MAKNKNKSKRNPIVKLTEQEQLAQEKKAKQASQKQAIIMFTSGILLLAVEFIPGKGLWLWLKSLLFGMFGLSAVLLPIALIYIAVVIAFDKLEGNPKDKIWQIAVFVLLICGLSEVLSADPYAGANFWEKLQILYKGGSGYTTGGIFSTIIGWPLLALCGETGAVIIMLLFLFAFFMILTNSTLVSFFLGVKKSATTVGGIYSAVSDTRRSKKMDRLQQEQADYERLVNTENANGYQEPIHQNQQEEQDYLQQTPYEYVDEYEYEDEYEYQDEYEYETEEKQNTNNYEQDWSTNNNTSTLDFSNDLEKVFNKVQNQVNTEPKQTPLHTQPAQNKANDNPFNQPFSQPQQKPPPKAPPHKPKQETTTPPRRTVEELLEMERRRTARTAKKYDDYSHTENKSIKHIEVLSVVEEEIEKEEAEKADAEFERIVKYGQINELEQPINIVNDAWRESKEKEEQENEIVEKVSYYQHLINDLVDDEVEEKTEEKVEEEPLRGNQMDKPLSSTLPIDDIIDNTDKPLSSTLPTDNETKTTGKPLSNTLPTDNETKTTDKPLSSTLPTDDAIKTTDKPLSSTLPTDDETKTTDKPLCNTLPTDEDIKTNAMPIEKKDLSNINKPLASTLTDKDYELEDTDEPTDTSYIEEKTEEPIKPKTKQFSKPLADTLPKANNEFDEHIVSKPKEMDAPFSNTTKPKENIQKPIEKEPAPTPTPIKHKYNSQVTETVNDSYSTQLLEEQQKTRVDSRVTEFEENQNSNSTDDYMYYDYPPTSLLKPAPKNSNRNTYEELQEIGDLLIDTLASFKVQATMLDISKGPSVTRYEIKPATGVKISKIMGLGDDIALNLSASGVRVAPIPEKSAVGIEVPNQTTDIVTMREIIESDDFDHADSNLSIALGKDITGKNVIGNIATMPHMLIAGSTGAGKSVCINSIIMSILYKSSPEDVRLLMIDPKVVELGVYNGIPHLLVPVVTDPRKAAGALAWAVKEMLKRYELLAENNVRDIKGYNALEGDHIVPMPQIVIIIDELADLMMAASKEVEDSICRLAQMARAAGMHLIIATQRPSVDVITGLIKANVPSRIAFAVSSQIDSRTILDSSGAEKLLGKGDMLFSPIGVNKPIRVQGCFVSDDEINKVVNFIKAESKADYDEKILQEIENQSLEKGGKSDKNSGGGFDDTDELLEDAIQIVVDAGKASTSSLQRKLRVGYARAARIIDEMEERGIVSQADGSKPRQVLISKQQWYEMKLNSSN